MNITITSQKVTTYLAILAMAALLVVPFSNVSATSTSADLSLQKECVNNDGKISVDAPNGLDSYELTNTDSQTEVASNPSGVSSGTTITINNLDDGNYSFAGELGNDFQTITFSIDCDDTSEDVCEPSPNSDLSMLNFDPQTGSVTIKNNSDDCAYDVGIASYKGFELNSNGDQAKLNSQELFDDKTTRLQAGEKKTLDIDVPSCAYQIDAFYGDLIEDFSSGDRYGDRKLAYSHENLDNLCKPKLELSQQCVPGENTGDLEVTAPDGLDSWELINTATDTTVESGGAVSSGGTVELDDLSDGDYRFEGTLGDSTETESVTFDCEIPTESPTCPFDSSDGTVINLDERIRTDKSESDSRTQTASLNLEAGTYNIKLYGYDQHDGRSGQTQPQESYYLSLLDNGQEVAQTPALGDLSDGSDFADKTKSINGFELASSIDSVVGVHVAYPDSNPNSLNAHCAAFEKVKDEEDDADLTLNKQCVDGSGKITVDAPNGLDSYKLIDTDTQTELVDDADGVAPGTTITIDDLDNSSYRFEGTLGTDFETIDFTIDDCDEPEDDDLTGSCDVSDSTVEPGENVTFSSDASGGDTPYSFSWDLEGSSDDDNTQNVTTSYNSEGRYDGTVTITDDSGEEITRTCSVRVKEDDNGGGGGGGGDRLPPRDDDDNGDVRGDRDEDFSVQCLPDSSTYRIGEQVLFEATIDGDIDEDDVEFSWGGDGNFDEDEEKATAQYTTSGVKTVEVEAEYDGDTESDTCYVQIGRGDGVTLDQVPYTGPGDVAKTLGFITTLILLALAGGYAVVRRREEDGIPVGIPTNQG